jgi:hypothetical protein
MKRAVLLLVAACQATNGDDYPVGPGGGGGPIVSGGGGANDAGVDGGDGDAGVQLTGKVCLLTDLRDVTNLTDCDDSNAFARGLIVTLGNRTATTTNGGAFTITAPRGAGFTWTVRGPVDQRIIRSVMPFGTDNVIPAITFDDYEDLLETNIATVAEGQGSVVMRVVRGVAGVPQVIGTTAGQEIVLYDSATSADIWNSGTVGTGAAGVVWMPGVEVPSPQTSLTINLTQQGTPLASPQVIVEDQTITFLTVDLQ